jgi:hypothetical protein
MTQEEKFIGFMAILFMWYVVYGFDWHGVLKIIRRQDFLECEECIPEEHNNMNRQRVSVRNEILRFIDTRWPFKK